jgi:hypothetical protein
MPNLQEKFSALKRKHPAFQNIKISLLFSIFLVLFALLDPDPAIEINADPDPKSWI